MEYIQKLNNINFANANLYPQARYPEARMSAYSNTNGSSYCTNNSNGVSTSENYYLDPIAKQASNNITRSFNVRIQNANMLNKSLEIIKKSVMDEAEDEAIYNIMINQAMQDEDKEILKDIANDEKKHNMMLRKIYFSLTGMNIPEYNKMPNIQTNTYLNNLKKSLFGEINAIKKYRSILASMSDKESYNMIMEIMTDEITHANKYNYLIAKYLLNKDETKDTIRE